MNKSQIEDALRTRARFVIRTADGMEYRVLTRDHIFLSPKGTFVQIVDDDERVTSIPLLTMTAVEYNPAPQDR